MLKHHADAEFARHLRIMDMRRFAAPKNSPAIRPHRAEKNINQSAFTGAIFPDKRMLFAAAHCKMDIIIRAQIAITFANAARLQQKFAHNGLL